MCVYSMPVAACLLAAYKVITHLLQFFIYLQLNCKLRSRIINLPNLAMAMAMAATSTTFFITLFLIITLSGSHAASNAEPPSTFSQLPPAEPPMETGGGGGLAPGPAEDPCLTALFNMSDCLTYVEVGSQQKTPDSKCCPELAGLVDGQPICLCKLLANSYSSFGIQFDVQKALNLPSVCGLDAPPASTCSLLGFPVNLAPPPTPSGAPVPTPGVDGHDNGMGVPILAPGIDNSNGGEKIIKISSSTLIGFSLLYTIFYLII